MIIFEGSDEGEIILGIEPLCMGVLGGYFACLQCMKLETLLIRHVILPSVFSAA